MLQLASQFPLFGLQLSPLYRIELMLQIGNDQLWRAEKQFECIAIEAKHDGEFLQKAQTSLIFRVLFKLHPER